MSRAKRLDVGEGLSLPLDAVTRTFGIVGQRGSGKTSTAVVLVEEIAPHAPFVVIDPTGAWQGVRSSADGKHAGLDVVVLGGHEGDIPLEDSSGALVAELVTRDGYSLVLDLELMRKGRQLRFVADFLEALYHSSREATHLVVDEAQRFAPQNARREGGDLPRAIGAMEDVVKLGRRKGLGATVISQRPASLNKEVLEQTETLIVHRLTGPRDRKAIAEWFDAQGDSSGTESALAALPRLDRGDAYVMSPGYLDYFGRIHVRAKRTFDSSAEPEVGEELRTPAARAEVDLDALRSRLAETLERQEADDPRKLRARIAELERELVERPAETERIEVPVLNPEVVDRAKAAARDLERLDRELRSAIAGPLASLEEAVAPIAELRDALERLDAKSSPSPAATAAGGRPAAPRSAPRRVEVESAGELSKGAAGLLETLARRYPMRMTRAQLATLSRRSIKSSSFAAQVRELDREALLEERGGLLELTDAGRVYAGVGELTPQTSEEVVAAWREALQEGPRRMLDALLESPAGLSRNELADAAGFSRTSSSVGAHLRVLRDNGLAEVDEGTIWPSELVAP